MNLVGTIATDRAGTLPSAPPQPQGEVYTVEATSDWFEVPKTITIPSPMTFGPPPATEIQNSNMGPNDRQVC